MTRSTTLFLDDLLAWLQADTTITDLLQSSQRPSGADGLFVGLAPQDDPLPRVVLDFPDDLSTHHMKGVSALADLTFVAECHASTLRGASLIADAVEAKVDGFRGAFGNQSVRGLFKTGRRLQVEERTDGADDRNTAVVLDFDLWRAT